MNLHWLIMFQITVIIALGQEVNYYFEFNVDINTEFTE